jgi:hypothetical protein
MEAILSSGSCSQLVDLNLLIVVSEIILKKGNRVIVSVHLISGTDANCIDRSVSTGIELNPDYFYEYYICICTMLLNTSNIAC